jgi:UDP:flavonoid glycosyltransferase YjiC (YdhE family)
MVPLARAFVETGADVCWACASEVRGGLAEAGFETLPAGLGDAPAWDEFYRSFPEVRSIPIEDRPLFMFSRIFGKVRAPSMLPDLLPIVRAWKPSIIVHDAAEFAAPIAAAATGVPNVTHSFGALLLPERVAGAAEQVVPLWHANGLEPRDFGGSYDYLYLDICPPSLQAGPAPHVTSVASLRPVPFAMGAEAGAPDWLGSSGDQPLIYVSFGTVFNTDTALLGRVVEALRELPVRVIVTVGPNGDPDSLGEQPANVHVARYIPQTKLLPECAAVVSHAGSGTFFAALSNGLPHLCLPQGADQFVNAAACVRAGAGIALRSEEAGSVDAIRSAANQVLTDPSLKSAAERLSQEIAEMPAPRVVAEVVRDRFTR